MRKPKGLAFKSPFGVRRLDAAFVSLSKTKTKRRQAAAIQNETKKKDIISE
jgi:hypothetical protein